ncbi:MAG: hypothetical protein HC895_15250 [Leptolyngbyaceae cyanobacterium SM1_3_5]|nr:hypothetical protein [Leptolyngbyaceae cyanobacterium SM1_3_5]
MKPQVVLDLNIVYETVIRLNPDRPEVLEEDIRRLTDLLNDLRELLTRHA